MFSLALSSLAISTWDAVHHIWYPLDVPQGCGISTHFFWIAESGTTFMVDACDNFLLWWHDLYVIWQWSAPLVPRFEEDEYYSVLILEFFQILEVLPEVVWTTANRSTQLQQNLDILLLFETCRYSCFVLLLSDGEDYGRGCGFSLTSLQQVLWCQLVWSNHCSL